MPSFSEMARDLRYDSCAAGKSRNVGFVIHDVLPLAEAEKRRHGGVDRIVELGVILIAEIADQEQIGEITAAARTIGRRQGIHDCRRKRIDLADGNLSICGILCAGQRVGHRIGKDSHPIIHRR